MEEELEAVDNVVDEWVAKLMDSTTTVTLLHIRQYGYLP